MEDHPKVPLNRNIFRAFAWTGTLVLAASAVAQFPMPSPAPVPNTTSDRIIPAFRVQPSVRSSVVDTRRFNPQIQQPIVRYKKTVKNNLTPPWISTGARNRLPVGGILGQSVLKRGARFPGISFTGFVPPDPDIAVGQNHIVQVVNSSIAFFEKGTGRRTFLSDSVPFFTGLGATNFQFDPKVLYDRSTNRFVMIFLELDEASATPQSKVLLAVSDDGDPNGNWFRYRLEAKTSDSNGEYWLDYPGFGVSRDHIVVTGNMFGLGDNLNFGGAQFIAVPKTPLLNGSPVTPTSFVDAGGFTAQSATTDDSEATVVYSVAAQTRSTNRIYAVRTAGTGVELRSTDISVPFWDYPRFTATSVSGRELDMIGDRMMSAAFRQGSLVASHTVSNTGTNGNGVVRWYEIRTNGWPATGAPSLRQTGNIPAPAGMHNFMPAINLNQFGDISLIYARSGPSTMADVVVSTRRVNDALGTVGAPQVIANSRGVYGFPGFNRWGDYFDVAIDPDGYTFWGNGEIAETNGWWGTVINQWTVSTPGSQFEPFAARNPRVFPPFGQLLAGSEASLATVDGTTFNIGSVPVASLGQVAAIEATFDTPITGEPYPGLGLRISAQGPTSPSGASQIMWLWNWNLGRYEFVGSAPIRAGVNTYALSGTMSNYISSTGQVRAVVRATLPLLRGAMPGQFVFRVDQLQLVAR